LSDAISILRIVPHWSCKDLMVVSGANSARQNSIWGLCIPRFVLGEIVWFLGFV
jgi:hypothetical protein